MRKKLNAHLEINHCFAQKALVDWIFSKFKNLVLTEPKWRRGNGRREAYRFTTQSLPVLTPYYDKFFPKRKKIVPFGLKLDALSLAVWFMDDGSKSRSSVYLNTQQYSKNEQVQLINLIKSQFNIDSTLNKDKEYFRIRVRTRSIKRFIELVEKLILPEFKYKLPFVMTP